MIHFILMSLIVLLCIFCVLAVSICVSSMWSVFFFFSTPLKNMLVVGLPMVNYPCVSVSGHVMTYDGLAFPPHTQCCRDKLWIHHGSVQDTA